MVTKRCRGCWGCGRVLAVLVRTVLTLLVLRVPECGRVLMVPVLEVLEVLHDPALLRGTRRPKAQGGERITYDRTCHTGCIDCAPTKRCACPQLPPVACASQNVMSAADAPSIRPASDIAGKSAPIATTPCASAAIARKSIASALAGWLRNSADATAPAERLGSACAHGRTTLGGPRRRPPPSRHADSTCVKMVRYDRGQRRARRAR